MVRDLPNSAGGILSYFTRHKTLANLLLVVLLMAGAVALPKMRAQFFPDVVDRLLALDTPSTANKAGSRTFTMP